MKSTKRSNVVVTFEWAEVETWESEIKRLLDDLGVCGDESFEKRYPILYKTHMNLMHWHCNETEKAP
jgi:hypothetical protein